jgi:ATPase subunit of ABC transporter with duplicated ATPase domains
MSVMETVLEVDVERTTLLKRQKVLMDKENETEEDQEELIAIFNRLDEIDAKSAEPRVLTLLNGLGFS